MKLSKSSLLLTSAILGLALMQSPSARAEKMDVETHTIVIEKMETVLKSGQDGETIKMFPIRARLADLYAERARLRAMDEAAQSDQTHAGSEGDRRRALELYKSIVKSAPADERGPITMQMAQMHELLGEQTKAQSLYQSMIAGGVSANGKKTTEQAYSALGETQLAKGEFAKALKNFEIALKMAAPDRRGYLTYRIAWCHLDLGEQSLAVSTLIHLLKTNELMSHETPQGLVLDESFQEDASRDLATFLCRGPMKQGEMKLLESLSPDRAKRDNLHFLAGECERLGNKPAALQAWAAFIEHETKPTDRLEAMVRVAQIRFDLNEKPEALAGMRRAIQAWDKDGCTDTATCEPLKMRIRKIVTDWSHAEKKAPTAMLLEAYQAYLAKFSDDTEMTYWAAANARTLKQNRVAADLYHRASLLSAQELVKKEVRADKAQSKSMNDILEGSLGGEIEMAELTKDFNLRENAYNHYLRLNPTGKMATSIRYQLGYVAYERKDLKTAVNRFDAFVGGADCQTKAQTKAQTIDQSELCLKAADLALDAVAGLKDDVTLEKEATRLAQLVPSRSVEYTRIARKSALNQVAHTTNDVKSSTGDLEAALAKLGSVNLAGASQDEKTVYWKNRLMLAEKAKNLDETDRSANGLLALKGLSARDREFALARKSWAAEMRFDFAKAFSISKNLEMPDLKRDERLLRLALLAELAGKNPRPFEEDYLKMHPHGQESGMIEAKIVRQTRNELSELNRHPDLERYPEIYAPLALEIFAKSNNNKFAEHAVKVHGVIATPAGAAIARHLFLRSFEQTRTALAKSKIRTSSDAAIGSSLTNRLALLATAEHSAAGAVRTGDTTLQLVTLSVLSLENNRTYQDIMALPIPRRLKPAQRAAYAQVVASKAQPFLAKHDAIEAKLKVFWSNSNTFDAMVDDYNKSRPEFRPVLAKDMKTIAQVAPSRVKNKLLGAVKDNGDLPNDRDVRVALGDAEKSPFSARRMKTLKEIEEKRGGDTMVTYLDARLLKLDQGVK